MQISKAKSQMLKIFLVFLGLFRVIAGELSYKQAVVISRHGSRELLTKDHKTFVEGGDSPLTIRGMDQMFRAGQFVQQRYGKANFMSSTYSSQDIYVRSSDYTRTLNSALSFLLGFYPPRNQTLNVSYAGVFRAPYNIQQVPIHTVAKENDQVLRGWMDCPAVQMRLSDFFKSSEFKKKEAESAKLRTELQAITGIEKIELKDFYNVYDYIHLHRLYNHTYMNITEKQWNEVVFLADWIEYKKYSGKVMGSVGGGFLASEIASSFRRMAANVTKTKLLYFSAHYPTILSLFSALGLNEAEGSPLRAIPGYASLVFFDLLQDSSNEKQFFVQFSVRNGLEEPVQTYSIPGCKNPCPLDHFLHLVESLAVRDIAAWCNACESNTLPRCNVLAVTPECPESEDPALTATGGFLIGVFVTLFLVITCVLLWHFCLRKRCLLLGGRRPLKGLPDPDYDRDTGII